VHVRPVLDGGHSEAVLANSWDYDFSGDRLFVRVGAEGWVRVYDRWRTGGTNLI
jgi:hypothetical protein